MVQAYRGREQWRAYLEQLEQADEEGGTLSPGGAALLLRVSRQRVLELCETHADIRAWAYYETWGKQAVAYEVSVPDLLRWAVRVGRVRSIEDLGLPWPKVEKVLDGLLQNVGASC